MASTNLSNRIIDTITRSHNNSLGLKLVFYGITDFFFFHFNVLMKIHEYAIKIISITYHRIKGICLSLRIRQSSMV